VITRRWIPALGPLLIAVTPALAHACSVCFEANDKNRAAFFATTIFLSLLPLGMIAGMAYWLRRRTHELQDLAARDGDLLPIGER
jgi:hypothetical protein